MLPDGVVKVMIGCGEPLAVVDAVEPDRAVVAVSALNPPRTRACVGIHRGGLQGVTVSMTPAAAFRLFGTALDELGRQRVKLPDLWGRRAEDLAAQLAEQAEWNTRFQLVEEYLAKRWEHGPEISPEVDLAWHLLRVSDGSVPVRDLVTATGWTARRLQRRFARQIGMTPKEAAGVLRLQRALRGTDDGTSWTRAAADAGYFDQPHFNHAFAAMVGWTPEKFRAARAGSQSDDVPDFIRGQVTSVLVQD